MSPPIRRCGSCEFFRGETRRERGVLISEEKCRLKKKHFVRMTGAACEEFKLWSGYYGAKAKA